ncbi:MAG: hypothetical protein H0W62_00050 [Chitinophagales bacterium]|nr:hypothetical protein [Chitinophagales bacterium]
MNEFNRISLLTAKINNLLDSIRKNNGQFTSIDKDLIAGYTRELYELVLTIQTVNQPLQNNFEPIQKEEMKIDINRTKSNGIKDKREDFLNGKQEISFNKLPPYPEEAFQKKSIAEVYAEKNDRGTLNEKYKKQNGELADRLKQTPIKDLKGYIGLNKRFTFINSLFNGDEKYYEEVISKLNSSRNYEEAILYVQTKLMNKLEWNASDPLVADFFHLILRRYLN